MLFGPLVALTLALVLVLGLIAGPFGESGKFREICIKLGGLDTDVSVRFAELIPPCLLDDG